MRTVLTDGHVFDGSRFTRADIAIEGDRITAVGTSLDGDAAISLEGRSVLPGLFDCHVHVMFSHIDFWRHLNTSPSYRLLQAAQNLRETLKVGITTVRDAGGADLGLKTAVVDGLTPGPRMQISIGIIGQTGGHSDGWLPSGTSLSMAHMDPQGPVDGPDEVRKRVREYIRAGADVLKVATTGGVLSPRDDPRHAHFRASELAVLAEEAEAAGKAFMAHAIGVDGIKAAVRAGARSIEHGIYLDDEAIDLMLDHGTYLVPTLAAPQGVLEAAEAGAALFPDSLAKVKEVVAVHAESFKRALAAGIPIAMGTDSGITPHGANLRELQLMKMLGMSSQHAIASATTVAAGLLGVSDQLGEVAEGKKADLVVIDGDLEDVSDLSSRIQAVFMDGSPVHTTKELILER
ncbi:MAG TPA: amidohydrolase family protein [Actinomycetota bacterium]